MHRDPKLYLFDLVDAADAIMTFIVGQDRDDYLENDLLRIAIERKFAIIGEAVEQLAKIAPDLASRLPDSREADAFRNIMARGYMLTDHDVVWRTAIETLPEFRAEIVALLDELSTGEG